MKNEIIPIEVKRNRERRKSLNAMLTNSEKINFELKLINGNIDFENNKFTFPLLSNIFIKEVF